MGLAAQRRRGRFRSAVEKQLLDQLTMIAELLSWTIDVMGPILRRLWDWSSGATTQSASRYGKPASGLARTWWAIYRAHWRVRHWFGPLVRLVRRQKRRAKRILGRSGDPGNLPG